MEQSVYQKLSKGNSSDTFTPESCSHGQRSKCADLSELLRQKISKWNRRRTEKKLRSDLIEQGQMSVKETLIRKENES